MLVPIYQSPQFLRPRGLGTTDLTEPGFVDGVTAWQSPSVAFQSLTSPSGKPMAYLAGLAVPILGALFMAQSVLGKRRR